MKTLTGVFLALLLLTCSAMAQTPPPSGLEAELGLNGAVSLTWNAPVDALNEDFEDGEAQGFNWLYEGGSLVIEDGYAKLTGGTGNWATGAYEGAVFGNFNLSCTFEIQDTQTSSRGTMWCTNGPRDADFQGYGMYISGTSYSVWKYTSGSASNVIPWSTGNGINTGQGAANTLEVTGSDGTYDLSINGTYHNSFTDADYPDGYVGVIEAYNVTWYDEITCEYTAAVNAPSTPADPGIPIAGYYDDMHNPVDEPLPVAEGVRVFDRYGQDHGNELDDFLFYRVYRDNVLIGTTVIESYNDNLPGEGTYSYEVSAYYDEGESGRAGPVEVVWVYVYIELFPTVDNVPSDGGDVLYDMHFVNTTPMMMPGLRYQTYVTMPNGNVVGPIDNIPFTMTPYMDVYIEDMSITVPGYAPEGGYILEARAGVPNTPQLQVTDSFPWVKHGEGLCEDFEDGQAQDFVWHVGSGSYSIDEGYAKVDVSQETDDWGSGTYTGLEFADFTLSSTFEYVISNGYSVGLHFCGSGAHDGTFTGYGVYISNSSYSAWGYYTAGEATNIIAWTNSAAINPGEGAINTLQVEGNAGTYDITINGTYVGSFTDATFTDGYVGFVTAYTNETWFDIITCAFNTAAAANRPVLMGEVESEYRDPMGVSCEPYDRGVAWDRSAEFVMPDIGVCPDGWVGSGFQISSDEQPGVTLPTEFAVGLAYPNPFNPSTTIRVALPSASDLTVTVFNVMGQQVAEIANGRYVAGEHALTFDASNLASGLYFVRAMVPGELNTTQKVMLVR